MSIAMLALAAFMTWFCHRRRQMLLSMVTSLLWFGLAMWFFFNDDPLLPLGELANDLFVWAFILLIFVPWLFQMDVEITHEAQGKRYTRYGAEPKHTGPTEYEAWRDKLYNRTRGKK